MAVLLILSSGAIGAMGLLRALEAEAVRYAEAAQRRAGLEQQARRVVDQLIRAPSPEADSPLDPVWTWLAQQRGAGVNVGLEDLSSRLNLNALRTELIDRTELAGLLLPGRSTQALRQYRADQGPFPELGAYDGFFPAEVLRTTFTVHGYLNLNTTFEEVLRAVHEARTDDPAAAEAFRGMVRGYLERRQFVQREDLEVVLGSSFARLYPILNVEPQMNVNFVPAQVLRAVLAYPYGGRGISDSESLCQALLSLRERQPLSPAHLRELIRATGPQRLVFQYLGTRTWFWRIQIEQNGRRLVWVVARMPGEEPARFAVLERCEE